MAKVKVNVNGVEIEVDQVSFAAVDEPWSSYKLDDGTTVKIKLVVSDILKMPGKDPVTGLDQFMIRSTNVATVEPPSSTKGGGRH